MSLERNYLFKITQLLKDVNQEVQTRYFTSAAHVINYAGNAYLPNSGFDILQEKFDESGNADITIIGIFERGGITNVEELFNLKVDIYLYENAQIRSYAQLLCVKYIVYDLDFELRCSSYAALYEQSLLQCFSRNCRANLGDANCSLDLERLILEGIIEEIADDGLVVTNAGNFKDGYFSGARAIIKNNLGKIRELKVKNHNGSYLAINFFEAALDGSIAIGDKIKLIPVCDKTHLNCCYYFDNIVNFRGEPYIPEHNIIKNK